VESDKGIVKRLRVIPPAEGQDKGQNLKKQRDITNNVD